MATVNLNNEAQQIITGNDNIVIVDNFQSVRGGRTLDVTGFTPKIINAGHIIIKDSEGEYKPMPVNAEGTAYAALPEEHTYAGVLIASIPTNKAFAGIMIRGTVNSNASPYPLASILSAVKTALPLIVFTSDKA